ncbi:hypothetical protein PITCH_A1150072 [uncultured Desulfobacterium sp.]|uniref:Amidohydrolase-related domain-containing protein n=1 Tax=uncultured Desulfobacterium sp. TaxID=201089 RepID=A0A445MRE2_9BACT|nr:hypothetical protein PITCH_A1150072 [uncultured Desulfobacterium sp.]
MIPAEGSDVRDVIVNGKVLMKDRRILTLDEEEIIKVVKEISTKIN